MLRHFSTIHSVDSLELAERLARIAAEEGLQPAIFLQVKLRPDPGKTGLSVEQLRAIWPRVQALPALRPVGLMTIAPWTWRWSCEAACLRSVRPWRRSWGWASCRWG